MIMIARILLALLLSCSAALAQGTGQLGSGEIWGNPGAARAVASATTLSAIADRSYSCSAQGSLLYRGATTLNCLAPGASGLPLLSGGAGANLAYGVLGLSAGGTNAALTASNGGIFYSTGSAGAILAGTATAGQMLRSGASAAPAWSTATWPATAAQGDVLYATSANVVGSLAKDTNATRYLSNTGASNAPAWAQINVANGITGQVPVANGGTNCAAASGTCLDNITGFSTTGIGSRTGAGTYTFSTLTALMDSGLCSNRGNVIYRGAVSWSCLANGTSGQLLQANGVGADPSWVTAAGAGTVTSVIIAAGNGISVSGTCTITTSGTCTIADDIATNSNMWSATANKIVDAAKLNSAGNPVALTDAATIALDMATFVNGTVTLGGNRTLGAPTNTQTGRTGCIFFTQDGTGTRTLAYNAVWKFAGGTAPVLTTTPAAVDRLCYVVLDSTHIHAAMSLDNK